MFALLGSAGTRSAGRVHAYRLHVYSLTFTGVGWKTFDWGLGGRAFPPFLIEPPVVRTIRRYIPRAEGCGPSPSRAESCRPTDRRTDETRRQFDDMLYTAEFDPTPHHHAPGAFSYTWILGIYLRLAVLSLVHVSQAFSRTPYVLGNSRHWRNMLWGVWGCA